MTPFTNSVVALLLLGAAVGATLVMLEIRGTAEAGANVRVLRAMHRVLGYVVVAVIACMTVVMLRTVAVHQGGFSPRITLHAAAGIVLLPVICLKLLVVRRYRKLSAELPGLGKTLCLLVIVLTGLSAGFYALQHPMRQQPHAAHDVHTGHAATASGKQLVQRKCTLCHSLQRVYAAEKNRAEWQATVARMIKKTGDTSFIPHRERANIIDYLSSCHVDSYNQKN